MSASYVVLGDFWLKRKMGRRGGKWECVNNGKLVYTYREALDKGIYRSRFNRAIKDLIDKGFLDVAGYEGRYNARALYALSERWRDYGTDKFIPHSEGKYAFGESDAVANDEVGWGSSQAAGEVSQA